MAAARPILAFDSGSPVASAALAVAGNVIARREARRDAGGSDLLRLIDGLLADASVEPGALAGAVALAGPGSFTGVRIACAAARALAQGLGIPAGGVSSLAVLALDAPPDVPHVLAVVDAMRGEWFVQRFGQPGDDGLREALEPARIWRPGEVLPTAAAVRGFGAERFAAAAGGPADCREPRQPAATIAAVASARPGWRWDDALLSRPLHLRAPATTKPRR